jgi:hypothetical protein
VKRMRPIALFVAAAMTSMLFVGITPSSATQAPDNTMTNLPVKGTFGPNSNGTFKGTFDVTKFVTKNGSILAVGRLSGTLTHADGSQETLDNEKVKLPVQIAGASCKILHLELGPLDLDLLGLKVHLNRIVLDITAQPGPGNLLGNLLCAIAHLLDRNHVNRALADILNAILVVLEKMA